MKYDDEGRRERVGDAVKMKCEINSDEGRVDCNEGEPGGGGCRVEMYDLFNVESSALEVTAIIKNVKNINFPNA